MKIKRKEDKPRMVDNIPVLMDPAKAFDCLKQDTVIGYDSETTGLNPWKNDIALMQFYGRDTGTLAIIQIAHGQIPAPIKELFTMGKIMVAHNFVSFDGLFLDTHGVDWKKSRWYDSWVGETVLAPTGRHDVSKSLKATLNRRLGKEISKNIDHGHWANSYLTDEQIIYAGQDVLALPALRQKHYDMATASKELEALEMEQELAPLVCQMTINGLPLKRKFLERFLKEQRQSIVEAEAFLRKLFKTVGMEDLNLASHAQLKKALNAVGIPVPSTGKEVLIPLAQYGGKTGHILDTVLEWKHGAQRIKMFQESWMDEHIIDDRVHGRFGQCSADTTRFTGYDPNLQQIPKDSRYIIGNILGSKIISSDYSQIEVRIAAYYAKDTELIEAFKSGEDVHTAIAARIFNIPVSKVTADQRRHAKALSFTLLFGGGAQTLYDHAKMSGGNMNMKQATDLSGRFFSRFKGLSRMKDKAIAMAQKEGPVIIRLPNGSRRILVGEKKRSTVILNTLVQGSASVGIKYGMLECAKVGLGDYLGAPVHDELVSCGPNKLAKEIGKEQELALIVGMEKILQGEVPVAAETKIGDSWQK